LANHLRGLGARRLKRVVFRANRVTIWSLTQRGTVLNLHEGYQVAPRSVVDAFAVIASDWQRPSQRYRTAARRVREWSELQDALDQARRSRRRASGRARPAVRCCATPEQRVFLRALYAHLNRSRFADRLPKALPLRFSARMKRRLGHMSSEEPARRGPTAGPRNARELVEVLEIALSVDLLLPGNEDALIDTLLHEMAHVADYMTRGTTDHGPEWEAWAIQAGCDPTLEASSPIRRRRRGQRILHVPSLPQGARAILRSA